jgi:hypothetical protein
MRLIIREKKQKLKGGLGDKSSLSDFDPQEVKLGLKVEMEHTDDKAVAREIVADHLTEDPHYYSKLKKVGLEEYATGFGSGKMGDSKHAQQRPSTSTYPYIKTKSGTKKETRAGPIRKAARKGPVVAVGAGFGSAIEENKE